MNKSEQAYLENRVKQTLRCINGALESKYNQQEKPTDYTIEDKLKLIKTKKASLKPEEAIESLRIYTTQNPSKVLVDFFTFPAFPNKAVNAKFNKRLKARMEELSMAAEEQAHDLLDKVILGLMDKKHFLEELTKIRKIVNMFGVQK